MTADGPLSMGRARARGRCVCQRPDDAEAVRKPRTRAERRALDSELEAMPDRRAGRVTLPDARVSRNCRIVIGRA